MTQIRFEFDAEKLVQALAFFVSHGVKDLDTLKAVKLLYFADRKHLLRYGRPILGDDYYCMKNGPIPTNALSQIQDALSPNPTGDHDPLFDDYLGVDRAHQHPRFTPKNEPDVDVFSPSDLEVLGDVVATYGALSAWKLRDLTHLDECVKRADEERLARAVGSVRIPFELFFLGTDSKLLPLVEADQENRDFAESLSW
ncbi:MAG TPA: Panacea domain-containing protein [Thermoanaerobaculia bacterium]|jgi:uncharacterized phage-associated protein|nr:Panacea domain-containing protein [Thermoanaerobaculia bacterium]